MTGRELQTDATKDMMQESYGATTATRLRSRNEAAIGVGQTELSADRVVPFELPLQAAGNQADRYLQVVQS